MDDVTQREETNETAHEADAKLRQAEIEADARLRQAKVEADTRLRQAKVEADATLRQAVGPAGAKLRQAEVEAEGKLRQAEGPAEEKLRGAEIAAEAKFLNAEIAAEAKFQRAEIVAEAKLQQAQQALVQQRDVFDRFFALSLDMMCTTSNGYFELLSPSFDLLGYSREELRAQPFLDFVHPDDKVATAAEIDKLNRGAPTIAFENRYRCKDGSYRWLSWVSGPDSVGTLYAMARDVTEARQTQETLARAKEAAEALNRELESFSYSVAHDLHAPLRIIDGFSRILLEDCSEKLDDGGKKHLSSIRESAQHMAQLIDGLLGLSQLTRSELKREWVDISALARAANARLQSGQPERRVDVVIQDGMGGEGDPRLLGMVLGNLLGNAWKFTGKRDDARIEVGATSKDGHPVYFVRDNGAGFDMAFASKLFGVFQRLHAATEFEGTGVGLATVQRVVSRHKGRVWAEGAVGIGATFYFTLWGTESAA